MAERSFVGVSTARLREYRTPRRGKTKRRTRRHLPHNVDIRTSRVRAMTPVNTMHFNFHLPTAQVAWDLVICHHYPRENVASQLGISQDELHHMLLVMALPWDEREIN